MYIEELLDEIIATVSDGFNLKLFRKHIVDGDKILNITNEVKDNLPPEFESAKRITENRNRIIESTEKWAAEEKENAGREAAATIENAQNHASEIVSQAKKDAAQIINEAKLHAEELVSNHTITREANERAAILSEETAKKCDGMIYDAQAKCDKMTTDARNWSNNLRDGAYRYAVDLINDVDGYLAGTTDELRKLKVRVENNAPSEQ